MSYGPDYVDLFRRAADYADKILRGAKPADLPVEQPTKLELVVNKKTAKALGLRISSRLYSSGAKALGLRIPPSLLLRATLVIE